MKYLKNIALILVLALLSSFSKPVKVKKKVTKIITESFSTSDFTLELQLFSDFNVESLPADFNSSNFLKIMSNNEVIGYAYLGKAPSKTDEFDYLILFDNELIVKKTKVLVYREDYGGEIGSKRWLRQFDSATPNSHFKYGDNIAVISGATISVQSMTNAVNDVLKSIKILIENNQL